MSGISRWIIAILLVLIALLLVACSNGAAATSSSDDSDMQAVPADFTTVTFTIPTIT